MHNELITVNLAVTSVFPNVGSIGGGTTLVIKGVGFDVTNLDSNVVFITVPVSSVALNGILMCDVKMATRTKIKCVTRPNLIADASSTDPNAYFTMPSSSPPA